MLKLSINGESDVAVDADPATPLLWALREVLGLTGAKYGCGAAFCGACTVHVDGKAVRSCLMPIGDVGARQVTTIEGLTKAGPHPLQLAWAEGNVPQCGFCQPGQIMSAAALVQAKPKPTDEDIDNAMSGNLCRCGTYQRIRAAIKTATGQAG